MSLSEENIAKLNMRGIYKCEPVLSWVESFRRNDPYHCINWTFRVRKGKDDEYYMSDTYWSTGGGLSVLLTDENFDKFEFLFDLDHVLKILPPDFYDYREEDRWHIAFDSGGWRYSSHYFVRRGVQKDPDLYMKRLQRDVDRLKGEVATKQREIKRIESKLNSK